MPSFFLSAPGHIATLGILLLVVRAAIDRPGTGLRADKPTRLARAMQVGLSLAVVGAGLYVILFKPDAPEDHKWAYGAIAMILGYWLRGALS